MKKNNPELLRE